MTEFVVKQVAAAQMMRARLKTRGADGQSLVDYALLLAFVTVLVVIALQVLQLQP